MTIDITKPLRTRDGREVRGVWQDGHEGDLFGWVRNTDCYAGWMHVIWTANGEPARNQGHVHGLVNVPIKHVRYVNFYGTSHKTRAIADAASNPERIACVRVEFETGRFDE